MADSVESNLSKLYIEDLHTRVAERICALRAKMLANWVTNDLLAHLHKENIKIEDSPITPERLAQLVGMIDIRQEVLEIICEELNKDITAGKVLKDARLASNQ